MRTRYPNASSSGMICFPFYHRLNTTKWLILFGTVALLVNIYLINGFFAPIVPQNRLIQVGYLDPSTVSYSNNLGYIVQHDGNALYLTPANMTFIGFSFYSSMSQNHIDKAIQANESAYRYYFDLEPALWSPNCEIDVWLNTVRSIDAESVHGGVLSRENGFSIDITSFYLALLSGEFSSRGRYVLLSYHAGEDIVTFKTDVDNPLDRYLQSGMTFRKPSIIQYTPLTFVSSLYIITPCILAGVVIAGIIYRYRTFHDIPNMCIYEKKRRGVKLWALKKRA